MNDLTITPFDLPLIHVIGGIFLLHGKSHPLRAYAVIGGDIMRTRKERYGLLTIAIFILIGLAFLLTNVPLVQQAIARASYMPYYNSDKDCVCLITVYEGDPLVLIDLSKRAQQAGIPLTIGVTAKLLSGHPELAGEIRSLGHALALYGLNRNEGENDTQWQTKSLDELNSFKTSTEYADVLYIPNLGQHNSDTSRFCYQNGLICLLYCKDSRMYQADSQKSFAQILAQNAHEGDFIYVEIDTETDFLAISESFAKGQLEIETVMNVLTD